MTKTCLCPSPSGIELGIHFLDMVTKNLVIHLGSLRNSLPFGSFDPLCVHTILASCHCVLDCCILA